MRLLADRVVLVDVVEELVEVGALERHRPLVLEAPEAIEAEDALDAHVTHCLAVASRPSHRGVHVVVVAAVRRCVCPLAHVERVHAEVGEDARLARRDVQAGQFAESTRDVLVVQERVLHFEL